MAINDRLGTPEYSNFLSRLLNIPNNKIRNINPLTQDIDPFRYDNTGINKALKKQVVPSSFIGSREELINQVISNAENKKEKKSKQPSLDPKSTLGDIDVFGFGSVPSASSEDLKQSLIPDQSLEQNLIRKDNIINNKLAGLGEVGSSNMGGEGQGGDSKAGLGGDEFGVIDIGTGANKKAELEAKILENQQIAEEERGIAGEITGDEIGATDPADAPKSKYDTNMTELQNLFTTAMDEQKQLFGDLESDVGTKTIEDYKADFQKATGIDVSGEPDNKMALMSLGLSLMQNKAGKGFDLSKILTSVGEAGEAAMPAFQKAKDDARAGQIAAGKFALQQTQADEKTKLALAKEKRLALSALSKEFRTKAENRFLKKEDHLNAMEQKELVESIKLRAAIIKQGKSAGELTGKVLKIDPVDGQKGLSYSKSFKKDASQGSSVTVFNNAPEDIRRFKNASFNVNRARTTLNDIKNLAGQLLQPGVVPVMTQVSDKLKSIGVAFGIKPETLFKDQIISDGKGGFRTVEGVSKEQLSETLRDKLIVEYKRFLTQETGNGISNKDVEMVNKLIGKIDFFSNPKDAIEKINQVDTIFQKTQDQINNVFTAFRDRDSYMNEAQYNKAISALGEDKGGNQVYKFGDSGRSFNVRIGENGRMIYSLKE
jgi:hypothetical protein